MRDVRRSRASNRHKYYIIMAAAAGGVHQSYRAPRVYLRHHKVTRNAAAYRMRNAE